MLSLFFCLLTLKASLQCLEFCRKSNKKNCFNKVNFTQRRHPEDNLEEQETENTRDREIVGIWKRLQAGGLIPETYGFTDYSTSDEGLITCETSRRAAL